MQKPDLDSDKAAARTGVNPARPSMPSTEAMLDLAAPDALLETVLAGRYRLDSVIAHEPTSVVYRAEHIHMRKAFAVRLLDRRLSELPRAVERFEREAVRAAAIDHPNVAAATDFGRLGDGSFYLVVEYVAGTRLIDELSKGEAFPSSRVVHILRQLAESLSVAHSLSIAHGNLNPWNVMLQARPDDANFVKVLDFGIVRFKPSELQHAPALAQALAGESAVRRRFQSPEQRAGQEADSRSDLYALGRIGHELLAGGASSAAEGSDPDTDDAADLLPPLPDRCEPELRELMHRLLQKEPLRRPQSAHDVASVLDAVGRRFLPPSEMPPGVSGFAAAFPERFRFGPVSLARSQIIVTVGALGVLLGMVVLTVLLKWLWPTEAPTEPSTPVTSAAVEPPPRPASSAVPKLPRAVLVARAAVGDEEALELLQRKAEGAGSAENWLALGRGYARREQFPQAMEAYESAIRLEPGLKSDAVILRDVREAAKEEGSAEAALRVAARSLDSAGADILYDVWVGTAGKTPTTQLARQMVYDSTVRAKASPALRVALELREAESCQQFEALLSRIILHGDRRVVRLMKPLQATSGCGLGQVEDCFPCLRDDAELLEAAIGEASRRAEPRPAY